MKVDEFDYYLPKELIAQTPLENRSASRLLVLDRKTGEITHEHFYNIIDYLQKDDVLVLNDTKVIPSRIYGEKIDTKAWIEVLLLKEIRPNVWTSLTRPAKRVKEGTIISFNNGLLKAKCIGVGEDGERTFEMIYEGIFMEILEAIGMMPLPPYIHEKLEDGDRYQTVYAKEYGSAAAPTAGLHFTKDLLEKIKEKGVTICYVTLHVGLGTFRPVSVDTVENHHMHSESYHMTKEVADILNKAKANHQRIISVGTTSTRTLESIYTKYGMFKEVQEDTNIFIYPPYEFKAIDALITNFHLPKSTLVMLVSAFATKDLIMKAYNEAVKEKYRFFSFGDAMFIK
ncbi:MAG: tRNA preQ1(34) S-adenosylmethionine ribosyltransferase-isomerase QueA [Bacilli bacterium]|nr:tRNA preQ1(34) S-adenosylmethionine ribosyltransferase-isomerase QueA [Bacilli bacterium]MDY4052025.1 tRNA preQ1(34) S-adenosylmethionine ribosyltransferase-isomerase QueA [Bacilli bacterium]